MWTACSLTAYRSKQASRMAACYNIDTSRLFTIDNTYMEQ